ncbi:AMP-binding protein [Nocardiopsis valliformis]|uniref:AMP-binding protein n=1 Tax=Nocardiopsis valliformis TaxID=239974 RepID=UPI000348DFD9|nr:AMP-binding protein [Nocardiopsis valliformis]
MHPGVHAVHSPAKPAAVQAETGEVLTYATLADNSRRLARYLHDQGLRPDDHLALLTDNTLRAFEVHWAALRSGLHITAVNRHLTPDEVSYIVDDCGAKALVVSARLNDLVERLDVPGVAVRLAYGDRSGPGRPDDGRSDRDLPEGYTPYAAALAEASDEPLPDLPRGTDMLYSSGTTGRPKGVHKELPGVAVDEIPTMVASIVALNDFDRDTVYLSPAPIYHAAPLRFAEAVHSLGGTVVLMERFDAEGALAAIERYRVTHSQWVPTMFVRMLKLDPGVRAAYDLSSQRFAVHAAAPCPVDVKRAMIDWWGPVVNEYYSSTEANGLTFIGSPEWLERPGSVGRALLGTVHVCDELGAELSSGKVGIVYFARDEATFSYHNDPAKTARAQHPDRPNWTTTGDMGYLDEDGYLFLTDRTDFMVISGGVNYPWLKPTGLQVGAHLADGSDLPRPAASNQRVLGRLTGDPRSTQPRHGGRCCVKH